MEVQPQQTHVPPPSPHQGDKYICAVQDASGENKGAYQRRGRATIHIREQKGWDFVSFAQGLRLGGPVPMAAMTTTIRSNAPLPGGGKTSKRTQRTQRHSFTSVSQVGGFLPPPQPVLNELQESVLPSVQYHSQVPQVVRDLLQRKTTKMCPISGNSYVTLSH